ncbi:hypothetical protein PF008_g18914 [Phytophthora fragariae]|uniref:Uncharacterized protein n=1 Tax=Phytophthora fragariae TaxID=53985 RepID=A0A6G0R3W8_9STRA|nr:hypothetical protein PF008_g18914 [Phytophthora fragariae]
MISVGHCVSHRDGGRILFHVGRVGRTGPGGKDPASLQGVYHRAGVSCPDSSVGSCHGSLADTRIPIPLPQTPNKSPEGSADRATTEWVFSAKTVGSPYFQDSHMVTPRSTSRADRLSRESEVNRGTRSARPGTSARRTARRFVPREDSYDDESGEDYADRGDDPDSPIDELTRQVSETERLNSTPRLELATHRPLAQIKHFTRARNKSENSV